MALSLAARHKAALNLYRLCRRRQVKRRSPNYRCVKVGGVNRYVHRLIAGILLGRPLRKGEEVHHLNGDIQDNHPRNLQVLARDEHNWQHHRRWQPIRRCAHCGRLFLKTRSKQPLAVFCSNPCRYAVQRLTRGYRVGYVRPTRAQFLLPVIPGRQAALAGRRHHPKGRS